MGTDRDDEPRCLSRFATVDDVSLPEFSALNRELDEITVRYDLPDHTELNAARYPWSEGLLRRPGFYASRLWEYPFAILAAGLEPGMKVADIGCGMTAFTIYLKDHAGCDVTGVDPDLFEEGVKYFSFGVSQEYVRRTGLRVMKGDFDQVPLETGSQDRVFCISVMEHVPPDVQRRGIREIARVLRPGGLAVLTVDVSMFFQINRPLDLVWESGLQMVQPVDLRWPVRRFGMFSSEGVDRLPADVLGLTLMKEDRQVDIEYRPSTGPVESIPAHLVPTLIPTPPTTARPPWYRAASRVGRRILRATGS